MKRVLASFKRQVASYKQVEVGEAVEYAAWITTLTVVTMPQSWVASYKPSYFSLRKIRHQNTILAVRSG